MFGLMPRRRERALARRDPFEFFGREFASLWEPMVSWATIPWTTLVPETLGFTVEELANELVLRAEVPGFEANEIEVSLLGNELTVRAEHKAPAEGEAKETERRYARWERTMTLPVGVEPEGIAARVHNGVLEVHMPRTPAATPRRIEVKT